MKFSKVFWATLLAVVVGSVISFLFWLFAFLGIAGSMGSGKAVAVLPNSILKSTNLILCMNYNTL